MSNYITILKFCVLTWRLWSLTLNLVNTFNVMFHLWYSWYPSAWHISISLLWRYNGHHGVSNHHPHECLPNRSFMHRSNKTSKLRVTGLCAGNSPETGEFPAQMASNAENVSIWWRHHVMHSDSWSYKQMKNILETHFVETKIGRGVIFCSTKKVSYKVNTGKPFIYGVRNNMAVILQTTYSNAFSWMGLFVFWYLLMLVPERHIHYIWHDCLTPSW